MIKKKIKQSLYMLADFVETQVPAILILNMMDVAKNQGISINTKLLSEKPGIPVVPMSAIQKKDYSLLYETIEHILVHPLFVSLICNVLVNVLYFALMMASFVLGITLGFNLMEETGYLARISFLFDHTMSKVGLQGKTIMLFFMGLGCTIAGTTGTRVIDNWGQRVLAIAMSWAVPCAATLSDNRHCPFRQRRRFPGDCVDFPVYVSDDVGCIPYLR